MSVSKRSYPHAGQKLNESAHRTALKNDLLKLRAEDSEDLGVVASLLQDAVLCCADMSLQKSDVDSQQRFVMVLSRFCWEKACIAGDDQVKQRVHCAFIINHVVEAQYYGFDQFDTGLVLSVLTIELHEPTKMMIYFAGDAAIKLTIDMTSCILHDLDDPYSTPFLPSHKIA